VYWNDNDFNRKKVKIKMLLECDTVVINAAGSLLEAAGSLLGTVGENSISISLWQDETAGSL
jgi:hypothetical protein